MAAAIEQASEAGNGSLLLGTGVAGRVRGPLGPLLIAEPRYASAAFAPPKAEAAGLAGGDITAWYPQGGAAVKAALLHRARLASQAQTPPPTPTCSSPPATPAFTPPPTPAYGGQELVGQPGGRLPTLLLPPPQHRPGELCLKRGIRPPPGLTELADKEEARIRPPPGLSRTPDANDSSDDRKADPETCSTAASSRTASASLIHVLADSP